jgi:alpha-L-arabinofuranosidase
MTWYYKNEPYLTPDQFVVGFVYIITNLVDNRKYIGKKLFTFARTKIKTITQKNGTKKKKKIRDRIDSDWQNYFGSNEELKQDVIKYGEENFHREILHLCDSKAVCSYFEIKEQILNDVILKPEQWYNGFIGCKIHRNHMKKLFLK